MLNEEINRIKKLMLLESNIPRPLFTFLKKSLSTNLPANTEMYIEEYFTKIYKTIEEKKRNPKEYKTLINSLSIDEEAFETFYTTLGNIINNMTNLKSPTIINNLLNNIPITYSNKLRKIIVDNFFITASKQDKDVFLDQLKSNSNGETIYEFYENYNKTDEDTYIKTYFGDNSIIIDDTIKDYIKKRVNETSQNFSNRLKTTDLVTMDPNLLLTKIDDMKGIINNYMQTDTPTSIGKIEEFLNNVIVKNYEDYNLAPEHNKNYYSLFINEYTRDRHVDIRDITIGNLKPEDGKKLDEIINKWFGKYGKYFEEIGIRKFINVQAYNIHQKYPKKAKTIDGTIEEFSLRKLNSFWNNAKWSDLTIEIFKSKESYAAQIKNEFEQYRNGYYLQKKQLELKNDTAGLDKLNVAYAGRLKNLWLKYKLLGEEIKDEFVNLVLNDDDIPEDIKKIWAGGTSSDMKMLFDSLNKKGFLNNVVWEPIKDLWKGVTFPKNLKKQILQNLKDNPSLKGGLLQGFKNILKDPSFWQIFLVARRDVLQKEINNFIRVYKGPNTNKFASFGKYIAATFISNMFYEFAYVCVLAFGRLIGDSYIKAYGGDIYDEKDWLSKLLISERGINYGTGLSEAEYDNMVRYYGKGFFGVAWMSFVETYKRRYKDLNNFETFFKLLTAATPFLGGIQNFFTSAPFNTIITNIANTQRRFNNPMNDKIYRNIYDIVISTGSDWWFGNNSNQIPLVRPNTLTWERIDDNQIRINFNPQNVKSIIFGGKTEQYPLRDPANSFILLISKSLMMDAKRQGSPFQIKDKNDKTYNLSMEER